MSIPFSVRTVVVLISTWPRRYSFEEEVQRPWSFSLLTKSMAASADHPFYPLKDFKLLNQEPLAVHDSVLLFTNNFNPKWNGLRRVKNVGKSKTIDANHSLYFAVVFPCRHKLAIVPLPLGTQ